MTIIEPPMSGGLRRAGWSHTEGTRVLCDLCPHGCRLKEGVLGRCRARTVLNGDLVSLSYGKVCAQAVDQIEKKPIYHYRPGSKLLSVGTFGCNLDCDCCQNAALASSGPSDAAGTEVKAENLVNFAREKGVQGIAFTFNEPIVWAEYIIDVALAARESDLYVMMNTNGFIEERPLRELLAVVDVFKVDVKGFTDEFYREHCGGSLGPVLRTCHIIRDSDRHLEVAYLIIPGLNDGPDELMEFFRWAKGMGMYVPIHIYRFLPAHRLSHLEPTTLSALKEAKVMAISQGLRFVYLGGMVEGCDHDTLCPRCGALVIRRMPNEVAESIIFKGKGLSRFCPSYSEVLDRTLGGRCASCGEFIYRSA